MTPSRQNDLGRPLAEFYSSIKGVSYVKQAAVFSQLVERVYAAGLPYAGYVKPEGKPQLVGEGMDAVELWGFTKDNLQPTLLFRRVPGGVDFQKVAEPLALTPLFFCKLDRQRTLTEVCKAADIAPLLMVLVHLGGDPAWLDRVQPYIKGPWSFHEEAPEALKGVLDAVKSILPGR